MVYGFPGGSDGKESTSNAGDPGLIPGLGRLSGEGNGYLLQTPWRRKWLPTPVFLSIYKQKDLQGHKESDCQDQVTSTNTQ